MRRGSWSVIAGLLVSGAACAHGPRVAQHTAAAPTADSASVTVNVTNNYALAMEIYATGAGSTYHMGTVAPGIAREFHIHKALLVSSGGQIELVAQPSGIGSVVRSGGLQVAPGDIVDFEIATQLIGSLATVRPHP